MAAFDRPGDHAELIDTRDPGRLTPRSAHIIAGLSPKAGGPAYSVPRLAQALQSWSVAVELLCLNDEEMDAAEPAGQTTYRFVRSPWPLLKQLGWSHSMKAAIAERASNPCILHTHGLWLMPNLYPAGARRVGGSLCRLVHSPRGMLGAEALNISSWKKRPIWQLWQRQALAAADVIHATARSEYEEIRAAGLTNPVAIIPNGIDLPDPTTLGRQDRQGDQSRVILSLGRIHPKKGLDRLIRAWAQVQHRLPGWTLSLVGPAELGHDRDLLALAGEVGAQRLTISGPLYADAKWQAYRAADLFVLPTLNENFGISVAEALACELPVISTRGAPWSGLVTEDCGWWIEHGVEPLAAAMLHAAALDDEVRQAMGRRGRTWMARDFGWDRIGSDMAEVYRWCFDGGTPPPILVLD